MSDETARPLRISLRDEWFTDNEGYEHRRTIDPEDLAVFCDFDNEPWPCSAGDSVVITPSEAEE